VTRSGVTQSGLIVALLLVAGCVPLDGDHYYTRIACDPDTADCDGRLSTGCESRLDAPTSCGACGVVCPREQQCEAGACTEPSAPSE
jgi:hypothetical protein